MKEFVDDMKNADKLEKKAEKLAQACGLNEPGEFGARYVQHRIVNNGTLDYKVRPCAGSADYAVISPINEKKDGGIASINKGPIVRLRENGFIVDSTSVSLDGYTPFLLEERDVSLSGDNIITYVEYVGADHPIIEYWEDDQ